MAIDPKDLEKRLPQTRLSRRLDAWISRIGDGISWLWLVLLATIVTNVVMRYVFGEGRIEFEELQWHFYAIGFLAALSYGVVRDEHVRVDFVRARISARMQAWVELYGILLLLLPFIALVLFYAVPFVAYSWETGEVSPAPGGLAYRWFIKGALFVGFALLGLSAWSRLCRVSSFLFGSPAAVEAVDSDGDGAA